MARQLSIDGRLITDNQLSDNPLHKGKQILERLSAYVGKNVLFSFGKFTDIPCTVQDVRKGKVTSAEIKPAKLNNKSPFLVEIVLVSNNQTVTIAIATDYVQDCILDLNGLTLQMESSQVRIKEVL